MALTPKERERIIEEERLRFETRQSLHHEACGKHRPNRWLWWVAAAGLAYMAYCHFYCGGVMSCHREGPAGKHCRYHGEGADAGVEPGQPIPQAPAKK